MIRDIFRSAIFVLATLMLGVAGLRADDGQYPQVQKVLAEHCFSCHGPKRNKGDVRLDTLSRNMVDDRAAMETWHDALTAIQLGEMPPADAKSLSDQDRNLLVTWIRENVDLALQSTSQQSHGVVMRRLNRDEYAYTMQDLLGLDMDYAADLPPDPPSHDGFLNNGSALGMSAMQIQAYLKTARRALDLVLVEGDWPQVDAQFIEKRINLKGAKGANSDRLGRVNYWAGRADRLPRTGRFQIRVRANVQRPQGSPAPVMKVQYGYFVGGLTTQFIRTVGELPIDGEGSMTFELDGHAELFPMPEANVPLEKVQAVVAITNALDDAKPDPKPETVRDPKKKKRKKKVYPEDPSFPKIVIESVELIGNAYDTWPPSSHRQILREDERLTSDRTVKRVLRRFIERAWRRPMTDSELSIWLDHFREMRTVTDSPIGALRETLAASLSSTAFLYLVEPQSSEESRRELNDFELASRLSYFLWSSLPDGELKSLAQDGKLNSPDVLRQQFARMMRDEKSNRFIDQFVTQWLDLGALQRVAVNPQHYPDFDDLLKPQMVDETKMFFAEVLRNDLSALSFLRADFTMANAALAKHYGLSGPTSQEFKRVSLVGTNRPGGLLGHASTFMAGSDGVDSHPIRRAVWIRERLLNDPPDPPPPDVPSIESTVEDFAKLSVMEQLKIHRSKAACADCHQGIDPWGIALEHYDAVGLHRTRIARQKRSVDASTALPGNVPVAGIEDLQDYLLEKRRGQFAEAFVAKLLTYALGRSLDLQDRRMIEKLAGKFADSEYKIADLMQAIVTSDAFMKR